MTAHSISQNWASSNNHTEIGTQKLAIRGILNAAQAAGWTAENKGWNYPVIGLDGKQKARRWKAYSSDAKPKYRWVPNKPADATYYTASNVREAVAQAKGIVYIAAGEVDVLTYVSAGITNVFAWFGETNVPRTLVQDLTEIGVKRAIYLPDRDRAGMTSAIKVRDSLAGSLIDFEARELPGSLGDKADTNDLWQKVEFDGDAFIHAIENAPALSMPAPKPRRQKPVTPPAHDGTPEDLLRALEQALDATGYNERGWSKALSSPFREDKNPSASWNRDSGVLYDFATGESYSPRALAEHFRIPLPEKSDYTPSHRRIYNSEEPPMPPPGTVLEADLTVHQRFISSIGMDKLPHEGALLVQSPIGTGKTELVKNLIKRDTSPAGIKPNILVITHRQSLAQNISERLELECYKSIPTDYMRSASQLVIVYNSLWKLALPGTKLPQYDLIIIDEIEQFHQHLGGGTFKGDEAIRAYTILRQLLKDARLVVGLDADASSISQEFFGSIKGEDNVTTIVNTFRVARGPLTMHSTEESVLQEALNVINTATLPVVIPTNSKKTAQDLEALIRRYVPRQQVMMICSDNSNTPEVQEFINEINDRLPKIKVLIFSPSLGTGVDISCETEGVFAVFKSQPLSAPELLQMIGRCRKTKQTHVYVQGSPGNLSTDWQEVYARYEYNAVSTGAMCSFDDDGIVTISKPQQRVLKLLSKVVATRNVSLNDLPAHFMTLSHQRGYDVDTVDRSPEGVRKSLKAARERAAEIKFTAVYESKPVDYQTYKAHEERGNLTPEIEHGHLRYMIETISGEEISRRTYDILHQSGHRRAVYQMADVIGDRKRCIKQDRDEGKEDLLLMRRKYHTARRDLLRLVLNALWGNGWETGKMKDALTAEEIAERLTPILAGRKVDLINYFGWRTDQSKDPVAIVRWLLRKCGLRLESYQVMRDGERFRVYILDKLQLAQQQKFAQNYLRFYTQSITQNVDYIFKCAG